VEPVYTTPKEFKNPTITDFEFMFEENALRELT